MNGAKVWLFEKINKFDKPSASLIKKKGRGLKLIKLEMKKVNYSGHYRNKKDNNKYNQQLCFNKVDNVEETDFQKVVLSQNVYLLNPKETEIMNRAITSTEIETVIKNFQQSKAQEQRASQVNSIKHLEKS